MSVTIEIVDDQMADVLRGKTEAERLAIAWDMWRSARDMIRRLLRDQHPDWTEDQVQAETARRLASAD